MIRELWRCGVRDKWKIQIYHNDCRITYASALYNKTQMGWDIFWTGNALAPGKPLIRNVKSDMIHQALLLAIPDAKRVI